MRSIRADPARRVRNDTAIACAREPVTSSPGGDEAFVIVTDRIPVQRADAATVGVADLPDDPITAALSAVARQADALWIGRRPQASSSSAATVAVHELVLPVEEARRYEQYARLTLWPLYHAQNRAVHNRHWETAYRRVNLRFARAVAERAGDGATVCIHDHRLQLTPGLLRRLRPDLRIGFSMPIPFPPPDFFRLLPMHEEIRLGLLGADILGFQTTHAADNFRRLHSATAPAESAVGAATARIGAYPFSVDTTKIRALTARSDVRARASGLRASLGAGPVVLCIDSTDDADGVERRLRALATLFGRSMAVSDLTLIQILAPSGSPAVSPESADGVARQVARINGEAAAVGRARVHYIVDEPSLSQRTALYIAADIMMATPLRQASHLPALEYVAARPTAGGLVLSEFTAAAAMVPEAFIINPYDDDETREALRAALTTGREERCRRMQSMHDHVAAHDHQTWLRSFLNDLGSAARTHATAREAPPTATAFARGQGHGGNHQIGTHGGERRS